MIGGAVTGAGWKGLVGVGQGFSVNAAKLQEAADRSATYRAAVRSSPGTRRTRSTGMAGSAGHAAWPRRSYGAAGQGAKTFWAVGAAYGHVSSSLSASATNYTKAERAIAGKPGRSSGTCGDRHNHARRRRGALRAACRQVRGNRAGTADLGASTRQVTASIRSEAAWTGDAADAYTAFTGNLAQGVAATPAPLSKIALAVRDYAGCLQMAQEKVAAYTSAAEAAEVSGNDSGYVSAAQTAAQNASAAVAAWQAAGDRAAAAVNAAGAQLSWVTYLGRRVR